MLQIPCEETEDWRVDTQRAGRQRRRTSFCWQAGQRVKPLLDRDQPPPCRSLIAITHRVAANFEKGKQLCGFGFLAHQDGGWHRAAVNMALGSSGITSHTLSGS